MTLKQLFLLLSTLCFISILSGCSEKPYTYDLSTEGVTQIWIETFPSTLVEGPKHTTDEGEIRDVISYINGLKLRPSSKTGVDVDGMSMSIEILYGDGTKKVFSQLLPYFLEIQENDTVIYETDSKQTDTLGTKIYPKMQTASMAAGTVEEIYEGNNNKLSVTVSVFPDYQKIIGDKSVVTVNADQIYKDAAPYSEINIGDTVEFYIIGGVRESYPTQSDAYKMNVLTAANGEEKKDIIAEIPEDSDPYYVLFKQLFNEDSGLNGKIKYIAVDLAEVKTEDTADFLALMQAFCDDKRLTLLEDNYEGLVEKGLIKDLYFEEGIIISFADESLTDDKLVTEAKKWRSGLGAIGAKYTLEKQGNAWKVTKTENQWIS